MPRRVNTAFVFVVFTVIVLLTAAAVGYWYFKVRSNVTEVIARAEMLAAEGNWAQASREYQRAVAKRQNDVDLILKYTDSLGKITVSDAATARDYFIQMINNYRAASNADPSNQEPLSRLLALYNTAGEELGINDAWDNMYQLAQNTLERLPNNPLAIRYRGIAQANRMRKIEISPDDVAQAGTDLETSLQSNPDDRTLIISKAQWNIMEATRLDRIGGDPQRAQLLRNEARKLVTDAVEKHPGDLQRQVDRLAILRNLRDMDEVRKTAAAMEKELLAKPNPEYVISVAEALVDTDRDETKQAVSPNSAVLQRVEKLIRATLDANPNDVRLQVVLAQLIARTNPKDSLAMLKTASEAKVSGTVIEYMRIANITTAANLRYCEQLVSQAELTTNPSEQANIVNLARERVNRLATGLGDVAPVFLLQGRILLLNKKPLEALDKLDKASNLYRDNSPEALFFSARARAMLNEQGAAADRLKRLIELRPNFKPAYYELARIYLAMKQNDDARRIINSLLLDNPDDTDAQRLHALWLTQTDQKERALQVFKDKLNPKDNPEITVAMARLYAETHRPAEAIALLEEQMKHSPTDLMVLQELVHLTDDVKKRKEYVASARKAGATGQELDLIESQLDNNKDAPIAVVKRMIEQEKDPVRRAMSLYSFYMQVDRVAEARAQLAEAAKLNPDDQQVLDTQFQIAIQENDLNTADALASKAAKLNLDQAQGLFYQGRLEMARRRPEQAAAVFRRATTARPIYSDGWRLLADALAMSGDAGGAIAAYENAIKQRPDNADAYRGRAACFDFQGQHAKALADLQRAYDLSPGNAAIATIYLTYEENHGDKQRALAIRQEIAKSNPENLTNRRILASLLAKLKRTDEADAIITALLKEKPDDLANVAAAAAVKRDEGKTKEGRDIIQNYVNAKGDKATTDDWVLLARYLRDLGEWDSSLAAYRQATAIEDPKQRPASREMADLLFDLRKFPEAIESYKKLYEQNPYDKRTALRLVDSLLQNGQVDPAKETLTRINRDFKPDASSLLLEAVIARLKHDVNVAMEKLAEAEKIQPNLASIFLERATLLSTDPSHDNEVFKNLQKALELQPSFTQARLALAAAYSRRGDTNEAIHELSVLIDREPRNTQARLQLVDLYMSTGQFTPLRGLLEESIALFPREAMWLQLQANLAFKQNKPDLGQQKLREAYALSKAPQLLAQLATSYIEAKKYRDAINTINTDPDALSKYALMQAILGRALWGNNQIPEAKAAFTRAIEISRGPNDVFVISTQIAKTQGTQATIELLEPLATGERRDTVQLAIAGMWLDLKTTDKALAILRQLDARMAKNDPLRELVDRQLAVALQLNSSPEEARVVYQRMVDRNPNDVEALNNLAYTLAEDLNNAKDALPLAQRAVKLSGDSAPVLDTLGWVQFRAGQKDEAYDTLRKSVDRKPLAINTYHLAMVHFARGDSIPGRKMLDSAKRLAEQNNETDLLQKINGKLKELGP
ncbi:MAG: tetratricopeptide repeat protein [Planctomycetes bacterium]|nr:tetratricopeptide repeat protein [Planctomycetota bacterium]